MSTEPTQTPDQRPTEDAAPTEEGAPTAVAARGRPDRWAADDGAAVDRGSPAGRSQLLFDPRSIARLPNLVDEANAYCS
jgi:hypothetical protein